MVDWIVFLTNLDLFGMRITWLFESSKREYSKGHLGYSVTKNPEIITIFRNQRDGEYLPGNTVCTTRLCLIRQIQMSIFWDGLAGAEK